MQRITLLLVLACALPVFAQTNQISPEQQEQRGKRGGKILKKMDKNNDRQISRAEWSRKPKAFDRLDQNHDGILTEAELRAARKHRRNNQNPTQPS